MARVKYRDAKYLCKYDLDTKFFKELSLNIKDLWPTRNIFVLDCEEGKKILKIINYSDEKLLFITTLLDYLKKTYPRVLQIHKFENGEHSFKWKDNKYIVLDLIEAVECNLTNPFDLEDVSKSIANLHQAGYGVLDYLDEDMKKNISLGNLKNKFKEERKNILKFKELASIKEYKNEFDELFLENVDSKLEEMDEAIKLLDDSDYENMCKDKECIAICHNDLAYHNIMLKDREVYFIDFDYSNVDLKVMDVYNFAFKTLKKYGFYEGVYENILLNYEKVKKLSASEKQLLYILFKYPSDFYTISKNYYFSLKNWTFESYFNKLKEKVLYKKERKLFLEKIKN